MSATTATLVAVALGALLAPATGGLGYLIRRWLYRKDRLHDGQRDILSSLQDAMFEFARLDAALEELGNEETPTADARRLRRELDHAHRRIQVLAARHGDEELWRLTNAWPPLRAEPVIKFGAGFEDWNQRVRTLFQAGS